MEERWLRMAAGRRLRKGLELNFDLGLEKVGRWGQANSSVEKLKKGFGQQSDLCVPGFVSYLIAPEATLQSSLPGSSLVSPHCICVLTIYSLCTVLYSVQLFEGGGG